MPFNFQDTRPVSRNGKHTTVQSEHAIRSSFVGGSFVNNPTNSKRMEVKVFLTIFGVLSYIAGIFLNINTWKADILFLCGLAFVLLKFIRLTIRTWQSYKREEIEQQILKKKAKND